MNFQQLRSARETVRRNFNLTLVAEALHTSQPGVSRQLKELEEELGIELFERAGRRLLGLTEPGRAVMPIIERLLDEAENLKRAGADFAEAEHGLLTVAATHTQARYALPPAVRDFRSLHACVKLKMHQGSPRQVAEAVLAGDADIGVATEALADYPDLVALPCYRWTHVVVVPRLHPLAAAPSLRLRDLADHSLITYDHGYTGRDHIDDAFRRAGIGFEVTLSAMDADVIKTYVELGLGVGIIASMAFDETRDSGLVALDARHLFATNTTRIAVKRGAYLRGYVYDFIRAFAPPLTPELVRRALATAPGERFDI